MAEFVARIQEVDRQVTASALGEGRYKVTIDGRELVVAARRADGSLWVIQVDGQATMRRVDVDTDKHGDPLVELGGVPVALKLLDPLRVRLEKAQAVAQKGRAQSGPEVVRTPMPGKVVKVLVKVGEAVAAGQGVAVVEAMKMENELRASRGGTVATIDVAEGQTLDAQQTVLTIGAA